MLELKNIVKKYGSGESTVTALGGVDLRFRKNEFVSILGASGCGKTTLLNIIGGLDRYTDGDLVIRGKSTKRFTDRDWDSYRNHSIGFIFQSYNLISHQTVLSNVELALTISGVSKAERRQRAIEALKKVGLGDQIHKKPNQMSGGQMQRVAIARALINNPDILLADEPTGALDTATSVQIMELIREISKDKLVIMVTHNPELAEEYSTRIVKLSDGLVVSDSSPVSDEEIASEVIEAPSQKKPRKAKQDKTEKTSMSFLTALSLSMNNLMTKKGRTILTSFAGSIGIIGIALILALSNGIQAYIDTVQEDTLSTYPLSITASTQDYTAMLSAMTQVSETEDYSQSDMIYVDDSLGTMMSAMSATVTNNLKDFKAYLEKNNDKIKDYVSDIQYTYDFDLQVYTADGKTQISPTTIFDNMGEAFSGMSAMMEQAPMGGMSIMSEMINNQELLDQQYELVGEGSHWPENPNEIVLVISSNNQISKMALYMLGELDQDELPEIMENLMLNGKYDAEEIPPYSFGDFIGKKFMLVHTADFFEENGTSIVEGQEYKMWQDVRDDFDYDQESFVKENGTELVISGIVRPKKGVTATSISGALGYTKGLTDLILQKNAESEIIKYQKEHTDYNVLAGVNYERTYYTPETIDQLINKIDGETMKSFYAYMTDMVLRNPEYSSRLEVKDAESFLGIFMLVPEEMKAQILTGMIETVKGDPLKSYMLDTLCTVLSTMTGNIIVTPDNLVDLLPVLDMQTLAVSLMGIPNQENPMMSLPGLITLVGEEKMVPIYSDLSEKLKTLTVNDDIFVAILSTMKAEDEDFKMIEEMLYKMAPQTDATLKSTLKLLGDSEEADPASINFYAKDFASKDAIEDFIKEYNDSREDDKDKLQYTDIVGVMMSSVSIIIDVISYVLIAFVSISLVVSSIMIGIITYISVLERTKEIGILRSIGASKKDISRVFNAETLIIGLTAGLVGIGSTLLLCLPINAIIQALSGIEGIRAILPMAGAVALILISMLLTFVAGLIPASLASKKDPVEALRTE